MTTSNGQPSDHESSHRNRGGAPRQNRNAMRHGLRSSRSPAGLGDVDRQAQAWRRRVEDEFFAKFGREPNPREALLILAATNHVKHARKAARWAREQHDKLSHSERMSYSEAEPKANEAAARCLEKLGLDAGREQDPWDFLSDPPAPADAPHTPPSPSTSADASPAESSDEKGITTPANENGSQKASQSVSHDPDFRGASV